MNSPVVFVVAVLVGAISLVIPWVRWRRRLRERRESALNLDRYKL